MNTKILKNHQLDGNTFFLEGNNRSCVILVHGFTATSVEVRPLANFLNNAGYSVFGPLLPGHGTNPEDLNNCSWRDWVQSLQIEYESLKNSYKNIYIGGESMGGVLSCYLAATNPKIRAIMLFAPAIKVEKLGLSRFIRFFKTSIPKKNFNDSTEIGTYPWQGYSVHPTKAAFQMYLLQREVKKLLKKIVQPTIIFQGKFDKTISTQGPKMIYDSIQSYSKEFVFLENSGHCVLLEKDFNFLAEKTLDFIQKNGN